jgi:ERCC4-type nuclease
MSAETDRTLLHRVQGQNTERARVTAGEYRERMAQRAQAFADFTDHPKIFNVLVTWFDSRDEIAQMSDGELAVVRGIGAKSLQIIRERIPQEPSRTHHSGCRQWGSWAYCPWCGVLLNP